MNSSTTARGTRPVLIILRAGDQSLHKRWFEGGASAVRNWDLHLSYYGDNPDVFSDRPPDVTITREKGPKAAGTIECISKLGSQVDEYDFIWLPDDDLDCDFPTLNSFFEIVIQNRFALSQPSLGPNSFVALDITRQRAHLRWRYTNFVEIMCPCFSRDAWNICKKYLGSTSSSWGIDLLFPKLLGYPTRSIAIVDETFVTHTRPPTGGENIPLLEKAGVDLVGETLSFLQKHDFPLLDKWPYDVLLTAYAGIDKAGVLITDPAELYRGAAPKREFISSPAADKLASTLATKDQLLRKICQLDRELKELDARWRRQLEEAQKHYATLEAKWRQEIETAQTHLIEAKKHYATLEAKWRQEAETAQTHLIEAKKHYATLEAKWRQEAETAQTHHIALDASWRKLLKDNTEEWMRQKAEYEKMLEAYRQDEAKRAARS